MKERLHSANKAKPKRLQKDSPSAAKPLQPRDPWQREMFALARGGKAGSASRKEGIKREEGWKHMGDKEDGGAAEAKEEAAKAGPEPGAKPQEEAAKAPEPAINYETLLAAKEGGKIRTRVGVGETVKFTANMVGDWTATAGWPRKRTGRAEILWSAPHRANTVTITFTSGGKSTTVTMTVVEPEAILTTKKDSIKYPKGTSGAGMHVYFDYSPFDVSFGRVEAGEKSGPPSYVRGYFRDNYSDADLHHHSGDHFTRILANNRDSAVDEAWRRGDPPPYKWGQYHWVIPNRFRVVGETGDGKVFTSVTQSFFINSTGGVTVRKGSGAVVNRGINDG